MGLGYPKAGEPESIVNKAAREKVLDHPIYSIYLNKSGGEILFGSLDNEKCSTNVHYVPLISINYWQFKTEKIIIGDKV
jgi:hypothetical protein